MKGSAIGIIAAGCLAVGFGTGFILRPVIAPVSGPPAAAAGVAQPTEDEATAAVRRHRLFTGPLTNATLKLGDCSPGGVGPGVHLHDADRDGFDEAERDAAKPTNRLCARKRPVGGRGLVDWRADL
jgi:hypothetical protein